MGAMPDIVPLPRSLEPGRGRLDLRGGFRLDAPPGLEAEAALVGEWLSGALADAAQPAPAGGPGSPGGASGAAGAAGKTPPATMALHLDPSLGGAEDYRLETGSAGIRLEAGGTAGIVRGAATLRQLLLSEGPLQDGQLVADGPRFPWRGFMLDCARNFFRVEFIERLIDLAALHKLNVFHWHLTDDQAWRLDLPSLPELARFGSRRRDKRLAWVVHKEGAYSPADVRRVVAYAAARHILVVPEIETPGHAVALLASHPELSCAGTTREGLAFEPEDRYGVFEDILCAGNEEVFELLGKVFDDLAELFPGPYVHAGGDEAPKARWLLCPRCRAVMKANNLRDAEGAFDPERLQAWFMGRVAELLHARGKRMIGWDEVLDGGVRKDTLVMSWRGYEGGFKGAKEGYEVVMCPQTRACYLDHKHLDSPEEPGNLSVCTVRDSYSFEPVPPGLTAAEAARVRGGQANLWSEMTYFGRQAEYMLFPRLAAVAEALWSPRDSRDFDDFARRLGTHGRRLDALGVNRYRGPLS